MKNKPDRIFIIGPVYDSDTLYIIAKTSNHRNSIFDIYQIDDYEELESTDNMNDANLLALKWAKKNKFKGKIIAI